MADETLVGEVVDDPFVGWEAQQYADYCNDQWQKSVTGIVQIGRALSDAKYRLPHGKFMSIFIDAPDGERVDRPFVLGYKSGNRLVKIAQDPVISNVAHGRSLPASWRSLYELSRFNNTDKERWIEDGTIHAGMQRSDIAALRKPTIIQDTPPPPKGTYRTIEADPPWRLAGNLPKSGNAQYRTETVAEIIDHGEWVRPLAAEDGCHLYLWAINPLLDEAFDVMKAWGFTYRTTITWVKTNGFGTGNYFRGTTEHLLFGTKGKAPTLVNDQPTHILADRPPGHSVKPEVVYDIIERCSPGPYIRLFARTQRPEWSSWGNQA